jgi:hypothetical protein
MKHIVLTVNYELFFGTDSGTVENSMIRPTRRLAETLDEFGCKMTVFWDILHFFRLKQLENEIKDLKYDREVIEKQIRWLIRNGHDVQMLLYPHWLDAKWNNKKWKFSYNRFSIHRLWDEPDPDNPETITGCITISKKLMEEVCQQEDPNYRVRVFRAGGSRVEPFERLSAALETNNILVDSSAAYGMKSRMEVFPFDYTRMPSHRHYRFDTSVLNQDLEGKFWEFPKESIKIPGFMRVAFYFLRNFYFSSRGSFGDGKKLNFTKLEQSGHLWALIGPRHVRFTPEEMDPVRWKYMLERARENSLAVIHAKNMSPYTVQMLHQSLQNRKVYFHSLYKRLTDLEVYPDLKASTPVPEYGK